MRQGPDLTDGTALRAVVEKLEVDPEKTVAFAATPALWIGAAAARMPIIHHYKITGPHTTMSGWIIDLGQIHSDMRGGQWAVTINS